MKSPVVFQNQPAIELGDEESRVIVAPDHGARVLSWKRAGRPVIAWPDDAAWDNVIKVRGGNPILFPFLARHFVDGKIDYWRDGDGVVRPMPMHGFARDAKFSVVDDGRPDSLRMRLTESSVTRPLYPFSFQFDVVVTLRGTELEIAFETTNRGDGPLPYYAGHHFYLAIPHTARADWALHLPCAAWGRQNADGSIERSPAESADLSLADPTLIDRFQIGPAEPHVTLHNSRTGQRLAFDLCPPHSIPWYAVTTWTQTPESDFYCVEPWLGLPNAIHHGQGLRMLEAGETERAAVRLHASEG